MPSSVVAPSPVSEGPSVANGVLPRASSTTIRCRAASSTGQRCVAGSNVIPAASASDCPSTVCRLTAAVPAVLAGQVRASAPGARPACPCRRRPGCGRRSVRPRSSARRPPLAAASAERWRCRSGAAGDGEEAGASRNTAPDGWSRPCSWVGNGCFSNACTTRGRGACAVPAACWTPAGARGRDRGGGEDGGSDGGQAAGQRSGSHRYGLLGPRRCAGSHTGPTTAPTSLGRGDLPLHPANCVGLVSPSEDGDSARAASPSRTEPLRHVSKEVNATWTPSVRSARCRTRGSRRWTTGAGGLGRTSRCLRPLTCRPGRWTTAPGGSGGPLGGRRLAAAVPRWRDPGADRVGAREVTCVPGRRGVSLASAGWRRPAVSSPGTGVPADCERTPRTRASALPCSLLSRGRRSVLRRWTTGASRPPLCSCFRPQPPLSLCRRWVTGRRVGDGDGHLVGRGQRAVVRGESQDVGPGLREGRRWCPRAAALPKVTVPGPLVLLQVVVTVPGGLGRPSSVTVPSSVAAAGRTTDWSMPASTPGGWFGAAGSVTVTVTSSAVVSDPSYAVRRRT